MSMTPGAPPPAFPPAEQLYATLADRPRTGLATAALVLGIVGLLTTCICIGSLPGLLAVILGIVALVQAAGQPERYAGKGRAVGGIVTGALSLILLVTILIAASAAGGLMTNVLGAAQAAAGAENIGQALQSYYAANQDYPPDLATLADAGLVAPIPLPGVDPNRPTAGFHYIVGLSPKDPPDWIVAYRETSMFGYKLFGVLHVSGKSDVIEATQFAQQLATFRKDYEARRGQPPQILPPPGETP